MNKFKFVVTGQIEKEFKSFVRGEKVIYNGRRYDFGYIGAEGHAIIYEEGECNMQDAFAVNISKLSKNPERGQNNASNNLVA